MPVQVSTLGYPREGPRRELQMSLARYRTGEASAASVREAAMVLRMLAWFEQKAAGVTHIPSNDFSLIDHVLDTSVMVGAVPGVTEWDDGPVPLEAYVSQGRAQTAPWFGTDHRYVVPSFSRAQRFRPSPAKVITEFLEARSLGLHTRPVVLGPITYLLAGRSRDPLLHPLSLLRGLMPVYVHLLRCLQGAGADWVQIDEPALSTVMDDATGAAFEMAYAALAATVPGVKLILASYFGPLGRNLPLALRLPVAGLHVDLVQAPEELDPVVIRAPEELVLSLGVVDARSRGPCDLGPLLARLERVVERRGTDRLIIAPSCPLFYAPHEPDRRSGPTLVRQKVAELVTLAHALNSGSTGAVLARAQSSASG